MTALRKIQITEEPVVAVKVARAPAPKLYVVTDNAPAEVRATATEAAGNALKNVLLFLAAPFIGLAYIVALPIVGFGLLAVLAVRAAAKFKAVQFAALALKNVGMAVAAPVLGLAFVVFFPVVGLAGLAYVAGRAAVGRVA